MKNPNGAFFTIGMRLSVLKFQLNWGSYLRSKMEVKNNRAREGLAFFRTQKIQVYLIFFKQNEGFIDKYLPFWELRSFYYLLLFPLLGWHWTSISTLEVKDIMKLWEKLSISCSPLVTWWKYKTKFDALHNWHEKRFEVVLFLSGGWEMTRPKIRHTNCHNSGVKTCLFCLHVLTQSFLS